MKRLQKTIDVYGIRNILMFLIVCIGIVLIHFYKIGNIPQGINVDEMGMGYDAYCLANYGVDRYLNPYPLYFINFCAGQSVLYGYICAVFVKIFGLSVITIRIPGVLFSLLTVFYGVKLVILKWGRKMEYILLFMILFFILPVFLFLSRIGLDCNLMLGMMTVFLYYFCKAIQRQQYRYFIVSGILAGLTLYSYILSYLMIPAFLLCMLFYVIYLRKIHFKQIMYFGIPLLILGLPLLIVQLIQIFDMQTMQLGMFTLPKMYQYRGNEITLNVFFDNLKGIWKAIFLFDDLPSDSIARFGNLYYISIPFIVIGLLHIGYQVWESIKKREWNIGFAFIIWFWIEILVGCCISEKFSWLYRYNAIYLSLIFFLLDGLCCTYQFIQKKNKWYGRSYKIVIGCAYILLFVSFIRYYFMDYSKEYQKIELFNHTFTEALDYLEEENVIDKNTYVGNLDQTYIYFLGGEQLSPYEYNKIEVEDSEHLWKWANSYKQYQFYLPESIELNANYIVDEHNIEYAQQLENAGFKKVLKGHYYVLTYSWDQYSNHKMTSGYGWDSVINTENEWNIGNGTTDVDGVPSQVVVGWAVNEKEKKLWDEIFLTVGSHTYYPEKVDREDIATKYESPDLIKCGMLFIIPQEDIGEGKAVLTCIDKQKSIKTTLDISILN